MIDSHDLESEDFDPLEVSCFLVFPLFPFLLLLFLRLFFLVFS